MNPEMAMVVKRNEEREALRSVIQQWNANRLDLFELSEPNENLEFHGVMRFYFQDSGQKVATKCIRVASDATAQDVIETLIEKFRPDMRMLSLPEYALFEIHENGEERKLMMDEKPLLVQLNWHKDDREGRFLLRRLDDKTSMPSGTFQQDGSSFRRKLSKREKKQLKKQEKLNRLKSNGANDENDARVAEKLYSELPETSFTRSISNPEAVMRRRRQQQERKLQQFRSKDGGPDTGGTLKIYGESLCRDVPYKTLLLSIRDTAQLVVRDMLLKYGLDKENPNNYCLVQVPGFNEYSKENQMVGNNNNNNTLNNQEYILDDDECPLAILMTHSQSQGSIMFHVRRRPADFHPRKRKKKPQQHKWNQQQSVCSEFLEYRYEDGLDRLPLFLELNPDGSEVCGGAAKRHRLHPNVTEVGCERNSSPSQSQYLQLFGPNILPRHCVIANTEGIVTVTPCSRDSETYVNGQRIYETTILRNGAIVKFGRIHCFRFLDPYFEERMRQRHDSIRSIQEYSYDRHSTKDQDSSSQIIMTPVEMRRNSAAADVGQTAHNFETTFDVDGNVETRSTSSQGNREDSRSQRSVGSGSKDGNRIPNAIAFPRGTEAILPAVLEIREETEEALLNEIITALDPNTPSFKLAPAYCLYLMVRYRASTHYRPELSTTERAHRLTLTLMKIAKLIQRVMHERCQDTTSLALWLANSSEFLFFLQFDRHLFAFSNDPRKMLAESVHLSFRYLIACVQSELSAVMPHFFVDKDDSSHDLEESSTVLGVLAAAMNLLRKYRVNVALTVQLFSHLFHFINVWAFNRLIASTTNYCSRAWGHRLKARLAQIEMWAERQGLEISTDTHLARIVQAAHLLQTPKYTAEDLTSLSSTCFLLNSLQLRALLTKYQTAPDEPPLPRDLIENVVRVAENLADELARSNGLEVKLEECAEFPLEFVLPVDSYSCEVVRGIPPGLFEFVGPLQSMGLCRLSTQPSSNGLWTVYMELPSVKGAMIRSPSAMSNRSVGYLPGLQEPAEQTIKLHKSNNGMGLSIVAAKGAGQDKLGIYIKSVVKGGAADADGRLMAGDQLLKVDGQSLVGITQEKSPWDSGYGIFSILDQREVTIGDDVRKVSECFSLDLGKDMFVAAEFLVRTGPIVTLEVAKQGAIFHGLATLLNQPSPKMNRGGRRMSERDLPSRLSNEPPNQTGQLPMHAPLIHSSKSVPSLNSPGVNDGQVVSPVASRSTHEVYNTGYNSTSSSNNLHPQHPALRSRSSQNLNDSRSLSNYPQNVTNSLPNRQSSSNAAASPPHHPQQQQPNYGQHLPQQQHPMYHQHVQQQQMLLQQQQQQQHLPYAQHNNGNNSVSDTGERFYQNLSMYRNNHEMPNGMVHDGMGMKGKVMSPQDRNSNQFQRSFRGSQTSLQQQQQQQQQQYLQERQSAEMLPAYLRDRPSSAYVQKENYPPSQSMGTSGRSQSVRDMLRQEAKLQEMSEEVRRREMRSNFPPNQHYPVSPNRIQSPESADPNMHMHQRPGPPGPVMYTSDGQPVRVPYANHKSGMLRATVEEIGYRESPPPPPPPPTSTHPLYQPNHMQRSPDGRYTASVAEPPKGSYYPSSPVTPSSKQYPPQGTNPWEREEREKEAAIRREVAKEWRDQQINELVSLGPSRNPSQEELLRTLKLEKEFERRVQEDDDDEEDDQICNRNGHVGRQSLRGGVTSERPSQEAAERIQDVMRAAHERDESRASMSKGANYTPPGRWSNAHAQMNGNGGGPGRPPNNQNINEEKERLRRLKELKMKQAEQEFMRMEGNRYRHKHEEDQGAAAMNGHANGPSVATTKTLPRPTHLKLDNHNTSQNNSSYSNLQDYSTMTAPQQRLDNLLEQSNAPPPPERGSSFAVMSQAFRSPITATTPTSQSATLNRSDLSQANSTITPKKVSFQETTSEIMGSNSTPVEKVMEDPNRFINEAESMLASPKSPDAQFVNSTPGVIGTQEVYRDPRQRRLLEQQNQKMLSNKVVPVPEKLTFKEKMKMFAMETGEEGTPKDKVKISRAQRDIDNLNSPNTPNNVKSNNASSVETNVESK